MSPARITTTERARQRPSDPAEAIGRRAWAAARAWADADGEGQAADEAFDAMFAAFACLGELKAQTPAGALAQIVSAAEALNKAENLTGWVDGQEGYELGLQLRRLKRILYSVRGVLEGVAGESADAFGAHAVMAERLDPHAAPWERAA